MRIHNRALSAAFKAILALSAWAGVLIQCDAFDGRFDASALRYYTLMSNLLIAGYFSVAAVLALRGADAPLSNFKGALTMGITVTGLVFHLLLSDGSFRMGSADAVANQLLHTVTPIMAVLDWLLFNEKGRYGWRSPFLWTILPNLYFVWATIYGFTSGKRYYDGLRFPYFFMNFDHLGTGRVLRNVLTLNLAFIALGFVFVLADWLMKRRATRNAQAAAESTEARLN